MLHQYGVNDLKRLGFVDVEILKDSKAIFYKEEFIQMIDPMS